MGRFRRGRAGPRRPEDRAAPRRNLLQQLVSRPLPGNVQRQHQRLDERTDDPVGAVAEAIVRQRADGNRGLLRKPVREQRGGRQEGVQQTGVEPLVARVAASPGRLPQPRQPRLSQVELPPHHARRSRQRISRRRELRQQPDARRGSVPARCRSIDGRMARFEMIEEGGQRFRRGRCPRSTADVEVRQTLDEQPGRREIGDDVMLVELPDPVALAASGQRGRARPVEKIERTLRAVRQPCQRARPRIGLSREIPAVQRDAGGFPGELAGLSVDLAEPQPQGVRGRDEVPQGFAEDLDVEVRDPLAGHAARVDRTVGEKPPRRPEPALNRIEGMGSGRSLDARPQEVLHRKSSRMFNRWQR